MILVVTGSDDSTADYLCRRLERDRIPFVRFDTDADLPGVECSFDGRGPKLRLSDRSLEPPDVTHVWFRRPKPIKLVFDASPAELRHAAQEWSEAIEGFLAHIPEQRWINHPSRNANASHKLEQLSRARSHGLSTPDTIVTQRADALREFWSLCAGQIVVKPIACGFIERPAPDSNSLIYTSDVQLADLEDLSSLGNCPTLFQRRINKVDDVRVTVVDDDLVAVSLKANDAGHQRTDIRRDNMADVTYSIRTMPTDVRAAMLALVRGYGLRFAAIDFVIDVNDHWYFLEVNPNGQWAWLDLVGASDIASFFVRSFSLPAPD